MQATAKAAPDPRVGQQGGSMRSKVLMHTFAPLIGLALPAILMPAVPILASAQAGNIYQATLAETNQKTQEVSTEQVRRILADGSAIILDARKRLEYGAWNWDRFFTFDIHSKAKELTLTVTVLFQNQRALSSSIQLDTFGAAELALVP